MKIPKCSKCGKYPYSLEGYGLVLEDATLNENGEIIEMYRDPSNFSPQYVEAHCICGHIWKLRKTRQILTEWTNHLYEET